MQLSSWIIGIIVACVVAYVMNRRRRPPLDYSGAQLVFVLSPTCSFCKMSYPAWQAAKMAHAALDTKTLVRGDDDAEMSPLSVEAYPTFILRRNGREVSRTMGAKREAELDAWLRGALARAPAGHP